MEILEGNKLLDSITNLGSERLFIDVSDDVINKLEYFSFQKTAYHNLFQTYINSLYEEVNELNLEKFLDAYTQLYIDEARFSNQYILELVGTGVYNILVSGNYNYAINRDIKKLIIFRKNSEVQ